MTCQCGGTEFYIRRGKPSKVCKECERKKARERRKRAYEQNKKKIQKQNAGWRERSSYSAKIAERYREDLEFRELHKSRVKVSREFEIRYDSVPEKSIDQLKNFFSRFDSIHEFIDQVQEIGYLFKSEDLEKIQQRLTGSQIADPLPQSHIGLAYLDNIFSHRFKAKTSGFTSFHDAFQSKQELLKVVQYIVDSGRIPTQKLIIRNLQFKNHIPSHFFPQSATALLNEFAKNGNVYDPFLGWGGRTLGASCSRAKSIVGTDLNFKSVTGCRKVCEDFRFNGQFFHSDFREYVRTTSSKFDLVIASPPFLDTEDYGNELLTLRNWITSIVIPLSECGSKILKPGGIFAIHGQDRSNVPVLSSILAGFSGRSYELINEFKYGKREGQSVLIFKNK